LTIGLVGAAAFLIVSIGAFRASPPAEGDRHGGTGGFALVGESNQPIYENLSEPSELSASTADQKLIGGASIIAIRVRPGDDASCLNLYQPQQPRVLGVPRRFIERGGFAWSGSLASTPAEEANPWLLLEKDYGATAEGQPIMPVVLDAATAEYSLHLGGRSHPGGLGAMYWLPFAKAPHGLVPCLVVGLLANSILQGDLVTSEASLLRHFPETSGYRFFAIDAPREHRAEIEAALERALGDYGFDARGAEARLAGFLVVQNTYLSTFQSLGGLGLLLGTLGLAVVELRNVLERRGELALLRAVGFRHRLLAALVGGENVMLLLAGLSIGLASAAVAVSPHLIRGQAGMPWSGLGLMIGLVVLSGLLTTWIAVRAALAAPLVAALRGA
jgi:putative ABC transport system permease protein